MGQKACALELKPYLHNNDDLWKKIDTFSPEITPAATKMVIFGPKKHILVRILKTLQMSCASELKPYTINNDDWWKKLGCHNTKKPQTENASEK